MTWPVLAEDVWVVEFYYDYSYLVHGWRRIARYAPMPLGDALGTLAFRRELRNRTVARIRNLVTNQVIL